MRLIDTDAFEKEIVEFYESSLNDHDANLFVEFMAHLDEQPTAYDVENVVEQLEEMKQNFVSNAQMLSARQIEKAIEIVRKGGVE